MDYQLKSSINGTNIVNVFTDSPLGKGATATVYRSSINGSPYAAKIFNDKSKLNLKKIEAMLANPPSNLTGLTAGIEYPRYSWPISLIQDGAGQAVGYVMPLIDQQESFTLDHYYDKNLGKKLNSPEEVALSYKLEIAANLSQLIADLHTHKHYFVDCKPQNIRVFKRTHAVTLLDCDGFSINSNSGERFPAELLSTDYISPEAFREQKSAKDLGEYHDRYALATIIFQLLNGGIHPFQGIPAGQITAATNDEKAAQGLYPHGVIPDSRIQPRPQSVHDCFDDFTRTLFDRAFMGPPQNRPSASEWAEHLGSLLKNKQLTRCDQHPYDIRHMRFMGKPCPECQLQKVQSSASQPQKSSIKLSPISSDSFSSPIPSSSSEMDPGIKFLLIMIGLVFFIGLLIAMFKGGNSSQSYTPPNTNTAPRNTFEEKVVDIETREKIGSLQSTFVSASYHLTSASAGRALPYSTPLSTTVGADIERTNFWFIKNNVFNIKVTNTSSFDINSLILSVYNSCSNRTNPEFITMQLGNNFPSGQERLFKVNLPMQGGSSLSGKNCIDVSFAYTKPAEPTPAPAPDGYASVYVDEKSSAFSWATGYQTQAAADASAKATCAKRGAQGPCKRMTYGPYKCVAIYQDGVNGWLGTSAANTAIEAESSARATCEKAAGRPCTLPDEGSSCVATKEKAQLNNKSDAKNIVDSTAELVGWIRATYPQYGYIEIEFPVGVYLYSGQTLTSASGKKYRVSKINGRYASLEPLEGASVVQYEYINSAIYK